MREEKRVENPFVMSYNGNADVIYPFSRSPVLPFARYEIMDQTIPCLPPSEKE